MARKKVNQFDLDEIYRNLRANIEFAQLDEHMQVINIVSTFPDEGKTTVARNLARIMAAKYQNVLLMDCDLRNPSVHKQLHISNSKGLSNIISEFEPNKPIRSYDAVRAVKFETGERLSVMTTGHRVPNPSEVLDSRRFGEILNQARKEYGYIIIDCPPMTATSDAVPISNVADGTLFVISSKDTDKRKARAAIHDLQRVGGNVFGTILTKVQDLGSKRYGYGYGYGYGENNKEK
ncbi:MAG: CpsD/CapB family tyrosine-protein kinase [Absicoccus sp.]|uniref:non-specific protein-tyrosine kinase n=1 Tax=Absicoccus intestinalis TaxID=2926319 RepID=A0ABU4WIQ0_9FIRM|nr:MULTISPECIES: CpsD/CapB family tyrosine-protein kinase [unclassified Absicoccus]MDX8416433.1 CpsD/CapB family tyrosine-protein kinase [Absicoccus sp. CLA-KB-P134]MDY3035651.1 CpsD/CapB family tyrosine-protein kinase [Absicoccus sp.]